MYNNHGVEIVSTPNCFSVVQEVKFRLKYARHKITNDINGHRHQTHSKYV